MIVSTGDGDGACLIVVNFFRNGLAEREELVHKRYRKSQYDFLVIARRIDWKNSALSNYWADSKVTALPVNDETALYIETEKGYA